MSRLYCFFLFIFYFSPLQSQSIHGGLSAGNMMYHGDLGHKPFYDMRIATAGSLHYDANPRLSLFGQYLFGHIGGADRNSVEQVLRNLSFDSHVFEWSLGMRINLLSPIRHIWVPYVHLGGAFYRVAPWTYDRNGQRVYLYGVHTQGNGLPAYPDRPADQLIKYTFPFGGGFSLLLTRRISIDVEGSLRYTFDDRMDDVGGYYPDVQDAYNDLSFRSNELEQGSLAYPAGSRRGNPDTNDWYSTFQLRLRLKLFSREDPTVRRPTLLGGDMWMY